MFRMTHDIIVDGFKPFKCNQVEWKRSVDEYADYAKFTLPAVCKLKGGSEGEYAGKPKVLQTAMQFTEGMSVEIKAGYNGNQNIRFLGFIKRINFKVPVEVECEGYSYQLTKVTNFSRTYSNTTVKKILQDVIVGTDITIANDTPDIPIPKAWFKNFTGTQVLEFFREKCKLAVYFRFNELYVGLRATQPIASETFMLNWNVIKDGELLLSNKREFSQVNIQLQASDPTGTKRISKDLTKGNQKIEKLYLIKDKAWMDKIRQDMQKTLNYWGYSGKITAFLIPKVEPGMSAKIIDTRYPERNGTYFIESVHGTYGPSGGRQQIGISYKLSDATATAN